VNSLKNELNWFLGILLSFLSPVIIIGSPNIIEVLIVTVTFTVTWITLSFCIKKEYIGNNNSNSIKKEIIWFSVFLILFLGLLLIFGTLSYLELALVSSAYTIIWIIRSFLFKQIQKGKNME
jgi:hypothetical protein